MRPRTIISLAFVAAVLVLAGFSFFGNVVDEEPAATAPAPAATAVTDTVAAGEDGAPVVTAAAATESENSRAPAAATSAKVLPTALAGLPLTNSLDGEQAKVQTEQLHGKALGQGFDAAWIAQYGSDGQGTLWISRSASEADAQVLMDRMTERIELGNSPFTNLQTLDIEATAVVALDGMGQKHYYFRVGTDLYWLAIAPASAQAALDELLAQAREVAAR